MEKFLTKLTIVFGIFLCSLAQAQQYNGLTGNFTFKSGITVSEDGTVQFEDPSLNGVYFSSIFIQNPQGLQYIDERDTKLIATLICRYAGFEEVIGFDVYRPLSQKIRILRRNPGSLLMFQTQDVLDIVQLNRAVDSRNLKYQLQEVLLADNVSKEHFSSLRCK